MLILFKVKSEDGVKTKPLTLNCVPPLIVMGVLFNTVKTWEKDVLDSNVKKTITTRWFLVLIKFLEKLIF
jgi:hypothetical protein